MARWILDPLDVPTSLPGRSLSQISPCPITSYSHGWPQSRAPTCSMLGETLKCIRLLAIRSFAPISCDMTDSFPQAAGTRLSWDDVPLEMRHAIERELGEPVCSATPSYGGFSPAFAGAVVGQSGRKHFVKVTGLTLNPDSPGIYAREARIAASLPERVSAPRLEAVVEMDGWIALIFELLEGHTPVLPWRGVDLDRVIAALQHQFEVLTPSPIDVALAADRFATVINGFRQLHKSPPPALDPWSHRHLDRLVELEDQAPGASLGNTLLHLDLRADNIVLTPDRVWVVDWPGAALGAWWVDVVGMAPSVSMQGGPSPEDFLAAFPESRRIDPAAIDAVLAAIAGYFTHRALQPAGKGLPTVRAFQAAQGTVARSWLAERLGWD